MGFNRYHNEKKLTYVTSFVVFRAKEIDAPDVFRKILETEKYVTSLGPGHNQLSFAVIVQSICSTV